MTPEQVEEFLTICRAILGEFGRLNDVADKILATKPTTQPPPKRGGR